MSRCDPKTARALGFEAQYAVKGIFEIPAGVICLDMNNAGYFTFEDTTITFPIPNRRRQDHILTAAARAFVSGGHKSRVSRLFHRFFVDKLRTYAL